jgi:hypothetical protein
MVTELQFVAVAAFLIWGLASSLCGLLKPDADDAELVQRPAGSHGTQQPHELHQHREVTDHTYSKSDSACDITFQTASVLPTRKMRGA